MTDLRPTPQTTLGILLGASEWPHSTLQNSPAFARSAHRVREYFLYSGRFRVRPENWLDLFDTPLNSPNDIDQVIGDFLRKHTTEMKQVGTPARDLLFYYIGHGVFALGHEQAFHLAIRSTRDESVRASALSMAALAETLKTNARQLRRIVILDCCFASSALKYMQSASPQVALKQTISSFENKSKSTGRGFPQKGTTLLCSSGQDEASLFLPDESGTMFSESLVRALTRGNVRQPEKAHLSFYDLKGVLIDVLADVSKGKAPLPFLHSPDQSEGDVASVPFFPNPRAKTKHNQEEAQAHPSGQISQKTHQKWLKEGNAPRDLKRSGAVLTTIEQAIRLNPKDAVAYYAKSYTLRDLKRYEEALSAVEQAIRLNPNIADFYKGKGNALLDLKRPEEALAVYEQAIRLNPNYAIAYNNKGNALMDLKRPEEALAAYEQAIRLDPNDAFPYNGKSNALLDLNRYEEALATYDQVIQLDPTFVFAYHNKGHILNKLNRYKEAIVTFDQAIKLDPNNAYPIQNKGVSFSKLGWYEEALAAYNQAIRLDPNDSRLYGCKGETLNELKRYEEALAAYNQAIKLDPNDALTYYTKGISLYKLGWYEEALAAYNQAIKLYPNYSDAYHNKGITLQSMKRNSEAKVSFDKAKQLGYSG